MRILSAPDNREKFERDAGRRKKSHPILITGCLILTLLRLPAKTAEGNGLRKYDGFRDATEARALL